MMSIFMIGFTRIEVRMNVDKPKPAALIGKDGLPFPLECPLLEFPAKNGTGFPSRIFSAIHLRGERYEIN
jgi:hypothetical protein